LLVQAAREVKAKWILNIDPDERLELGSADGIADLIAFQGPVVWGFRIGNSTRLMPIALTGFGGRSGGTVCSSSSTARNSLRFRPRTPPSLELSS
jgi:hypothetical protein